MFEVVRHLGVAHKSLIHRDAQWCFQLAWPVRMNCSGLIKISSRRRSGLLKTGEIA